MAADIARVVALGASNLTRGLHAVVSTSRAAWGPGVEVLAALGHGRSYGARSRLVFRTLPGILDCGLWHELACRPQDDIVITDLPVASIRGLSSTKFLAFRSILVPSCRLSLAQVLERVEHVNAGLAELASARALRLFHLDPAWYGFDPIHIRPSLWNEAWRQIVGAPPQRGANGRPMAENLRLYLRRLERRWMFGVEQFTPQSGVPLPSGGRIWLY